jgi:ABC-type lipoprotein release transport system permease subunit
MSVFSLPQLAWKSVFHHRRVAFQVILGTTVAAAALIGAMIVGDSVRYSLTRFALLRLGRVDAAMPLVHRYADAKLANDLNAAGCGSVVPVLRLSGMAMRDEEIAGAKQVNRVNVLGVPPSFWGMGDGKGVVLTGQEAAVGARLAKALGVKEGDTISMRVEKPTLLPRQAPLASRKDRLAVRSSMRVVRVLSDESMGRFSLDANQVAPYNLFVALDWLQERVDLGGKANLFLATASKAGGMDVAGALRAVWKPSHAGMVWKVSGQVAQLESDRVYLDPAVVSAIQQHNAATLAYLVSSIGRDDGTKRIPYSFAVACAPNADAALGPVPSGMRDEEVLVNSWVAEKLGVRAGDRVKIEYQVLLDTDRFETRGRDFTVRAILPIDSLANEAALVPRFPGLTDVNSCREWDIGMPVDEAMLKDEDNEAYWKQYRTTPKVFVTLAAGQSMWGNRFGNATGVRITAGSEAVDVANKALRENVNPASLGFVFVPVRQQAMRAVEQGMNFGELFLGMSFFLIVAALLLTGMLFAFGVERRSEEIGILAAQGFRPMHLRLLFVAEGFALAVIGSFFGMMLATFYTRALIYGLGRYWKDAVAGSAIYYHAETTTFAVGVVASIACAVATLTIAVWRLTRRPARELLELDLTQSSTTTARKRPGWMAWSLAAGGGAVALGLAVWGALVRPDGAVEVFFSAGGLLLAAGLAGLRIALYAIDVGSTRAPTLGAMGRRNAARRVGRSVAVAALLACGSFLVFAVSSMRQDVAATAHRRDSGTGGFALFAESSFDVPEDINTLKGRRMVIPSPDDWPAGLDVVSLKVRDGDDASCFNLNRAQSPRLLGVAPASFARSLAFCAGGDAGIWKTLESPRSDGAIPALVGDANTAMYGLQRKVGDVLAFTDERGNPFTVRLVGVLPHQITIFQGTLLIPMAAFHEKFPSIGGFRIALLDVPASATKVEMEAVTRRLTEAGFDVSRTAERLAMFYSVEETYLQMFLVLGGLGLLLGSIGLGIMVLRNVFERRGELAMLLCVGFTRRQVAAMVVAEHALLLVGGTAVGVVASGVAIWPSVSAPGVTIPVGTLAVLLIGMLTIGFGWTVGAAHLALRGRLTDAVRNE